MKKNKLEALARQFAYLVKYALSSLLAVLLDLGLYALLSYYGLLPPGLANAVSVTAGCSAGWFLAGKSLFRGYRIKNRGYLAWAVFLGLAAAAYSLAIQAMVWLEQDKYAAKILATGLSFLTNSTFFQLVILKKFSGAGPEAPCVNR